MPGIDTRFTVAPYDFAAAERLAAALGVSHVLAQVLVRRGLAEVASARAFLTAAEAHPLDAFGGLREAAGRILGHVGRRSRITVHGDYDVDGVAATAVLVRALRTLGADVDWYLPSRIDDGYGLAAATVARLAERGTDLLVTVDCAITAVEEVAAARTAGLDVVVTDHHAPRADGRLPEAPIVHPRVGGYPCADLCATAVAYKLAQALLEGAGEDPAAADEDLDLVALATVADVVPLVGENRRLVRTGLRALSVTRKAGVRALMEVARVDPGLVDATAIGFRLAPRINAAGRLHRADAGLELLLTEDAGRARAIAAELDAVNTERRDVETRILFAAEAQVAEHGPAPAYVLAAEGWHPGVIGIVAARIAERHHRPTVLIALDGDEGTGSGRSIPAFDLLAGLTAAARHLDRYGGHRAAAGLTIARSAVDAFRESFVTRAGEVLTPADLMPECRVDAVVPGDALTLALAEELERLAPFGQGNPPVSLMVPAARLGDPRPMGEGRHVAFTLHAGGARSRCVQFGAGTRLPAAGAELVDAAVRLEVNRWNGAVEPRLVLRHARPAGTGAIDILGEPAFHEGIEAELTRDLTTDPFLAGPPLVATALTDPLLAGTAANTGPALAATTLTDPLLAGTAANTGPALAATTLTDPLLGGTAANTGPALAATTLTDPSLAGTAANTGPGHSRAEGRRPPDWSRDGVLPPVPSATPPVPSATAPNDVRGTGIAGVLADLVSTGEPVLALVAHAPHRARALNGRVGGFALCSWAALEDDPDLAVRFIHFVAVDPPPDPRALALLERPSGVARTHLAWGDAELRFARRIHQWNFALREPLAALYRALRGAGHAGGEAFEAVLRGEGSQPRSAALAGRLVRVLSELDLVVLDREGPALRIVERPARTALERSTAFRAYHRKLEDGLTYLTSDPIRQAA